MHTYYYKGYKVLSGFDYRLSSKLINEVLHERYQTEHNYRNNKNSVVSKIKTDDLTNIILKIPGGRNLRFWERFLTLFRESDAFRIFGSLKTINDLGLKAPKPLLAAQKRSYGFVTHSFYIYDFVDGDIPDHNDLDKVLEALQKLHRHGYIRSDPKMSNFLIKNNTVYFIDLRLKKPFFCKKIKLLMNLSKFIQAHKEAEKLLNGKITNSFLYKLSYLFQKIKTKKRDYKIKIKSFIKGN